jgi:hypothetical protein
VSEEERLVIEGPANTVWDLDGSNEGVTREVSIEAEDGACCYVSDLVYFPW